MSPDRTGADTHLAEVEAEQAALRRIAALLARSVPAEEVFDAVVAEVSSLMGFDGAGLGRYEADKTATVVAVSRLGRRTGRLAGGQIVHGGAQRHRHGFAHWAARLVSIALNTEYLGGLTRPSG
jgi:hypothetical protein